MTFKFHQFRISIKQFDIDELSIYSADKDNFWYFRFPFVVVPSFGNAVQLFHLTMYFFGVRWNTQCHRLQLVQLCCWICWYIAIWCFAVNRAAEITYCSFDCLITHVMFFMLSMTHVYVLLDTLVQRRVYCDLLRLEEEEEEQQLPQRGHHVAKVLCGVLLPNITMQCVVSWCRISVDRMWNMSFFWVVTPPALGIQLKLYSFLWAILRANVQIVNLREHLKLLARNSKNLWRQPAPNTRSVLQLKQRYSQLSQHFALINAYFGNSLLIIFMHYFFNFTFNAYWLAKNLLDSGNTITILLHMGVLFDLGLLFTVTCWHCQQSYNHVSTVILPQFMEI